MLNAGIEISGLKKMEQALLNIGKEIGAKKATGIMTSAIKDGAIKYQQGMQRNAPESDFARVVKTKGGQKVDIRPGFLKSRIKVRASTNRAGATTRRFSKGVVSLVRVGVFKVPYVVQVEYGTNKHKAQPFIRQAFSKRTNQVVVVINRGLAKRIDLAQRRIAKKYK
ncbi:HK97-gp10 family putative phage morphogenesis protein [uncultured Pseudoalteromonas sp.]|uniref:HK97-gp10 family putative phage morphogenesis protein n=1 Tax=uncultured Pseudoalteromonas sp. TaxID=114053 RepID=UPI002597213D|nr:HK97-gp10 family putative phage morphogenesis protein [uncultured Pseudoalteromonas sp.]